LFDTETSGFVVAPGSRCFCLACSAGTAILAVAPVPADQSSRRSRHWCDAWVDECAGDAHLVSYNGKRFDVPAMRTLETLHQRTGLASQEAAHWDSAVSGATRVSRHLADCRLITAERMLVKAANATICPAARRRAPGASFSTSGATRDLLRVMQHNRYDLEALLRVLKALLPNLSTAPRTRPRASVQGGRGGLGSAALGV
jgi:uncharacterized protein YprB with RNaseH-like and TPR domain